MESTPLFAPADSSRLPSGRHRLSTADVKSSQRGRLLDAMVQIVAEKGYAASTVADVVERAAVSRRTFYEQFPDKESCFLASYDVGVEVLLGRLRAAAENETEAGWRERLRAELRTYMELLAEEPAFAWSLHVEILAAGGPALERRAAIFSLFTERVRRLYELAREQDGLEPLPDEAFALHSGGIDELVRECLRTKGATALPALAEPAFRATAALFSSAAASES